MQIRTDAAGQFRCAAIHWFQSNGLPGKVSITEHKYCAAPRRPSYSRREKNTMQHPVVANLYNQLALPVIAAPMFLVSGPEMVIAQSASGIIGSMPSLNARPQSQLSEWLSEISESLATLRAREPERVVAPWAINLIVHHSNDRVEADLATCEAHKVPIIITSLRAPGDVVSAVHAWGGKVFHDVTTLRHAEKALEAGVDGLILVSAGAGGHAGT